ncbi:NAD(P)/FAD-dependent oxidoreductase [Pseudoroseicyclus sp. CXY001]|uniref:NAD(P)/FAD-dependent oxidoreductase n=1 Tax=Pseudoroseicyclus sp. CXY001 TaxID=3242492 RepID=UPI00358DBF25
MQINDPDTPRGADVVIIGGGVTGLSAGWWLAQSGVDVMVLEAGLVAFGASGRNGGGCTHFQSPLFKEEQRLWPMMDELLGHPTEFCRGRLRIATDDAQMALYGTSQPTMRRLGYACEQLDAAQIRELAPLAGDAAHGGYFYDVGGHANPHRTAQGYAWALQDHGGRIAQHCRVTGFVVEGGQVRAVQTSRGEISCQKVVIAAGPQTGALAAMLGASVPMVTARAEMIVTEPAPLMPLTGVDGNGLYGRQTLRGNLAYGGGMHEWLGDPEPGEAPRPGPPSSPLMAHIGRRLMEILPKAAHLRIIRSWAGKIENTPDGAPVIDWLPGCDNALVATMSSVGFGLSPASGHAIRDLVIDGTCSFADLSTFRLARFDRLEPDWREMQGWTPLIQGAA